MPSSMMKMIATTEIQHHLLKIEKISRWGINRVCADGQGLG